METTFLVRPVVIACLWGVDCEQVNLETRRLYQHIADRIRSLIRDNRVRPGTRLPAERDLAQQLGVSRPSLREALIALEIDGSVEIRMGSGVYVCAQPEQAGTATRALGESPSDLMQARAVVEGAVIIMACARVTEASLASLRECLDAMAADIDRGRKPLEQDKAFHVAIALLSGNSVLTQIVGGLFEERHSPISTQFSARFESSATWVAAHTEHEAIYDALAARDPLRAQSAMHLHLLRASERWIGSQMESPTPRGD